MHFPIDVIFVNRSGEVLRVRQSVAPFRLVLRVDAFAAIELASGSSALTSAGDILVLAAPSQTALAGAAISQSAS